MVAVTAKRAKPSGKIQVRLDGRLLKKVTLRSTGKATTRLPRLRAGKHRIVVIYPGNTTTKASHKKIIVKVKRG